jgi:mannitol/fructose-specific phosphotransferase system IIA component (Ntr-type)
MKLSDIIVPQAVISQLASTTRDDAVSELIGAMARAGAIADDRVEDITGAILAREAQATTGIGNGVAFPHARIKGVKKAVGVIGCSSEGINFDSLDGQPVNVVLLLLSNADDADEHLQAMETIFRHVQRQAFCNDLRACCTQDEIVALVEKADDVE